MGYFSNATEADDYQRRYCRRCMHGDGDSAGACAVWEAHELRNYDDCNVADSALHVLIPRDGVENKACRMFMRGGQRRLPFDKA